jgi:hypothetical protein
MGNRIRQRAVGAGVVISAIALAIVVAARPGRRPPVATEEVLRRPIRAALNCTVVPVSAGYLASPVCAAHWAGDRYLVCNYTELHEVDTGTGGVRRLSPPPDVPVWVPTGVWVTPEDGRVFVANYTGHDVIEATRAGDGLTLVRRFVHPEMKSPENVALSPDGRLVAAADYDANRLWLFRRDGTLAWARPVPLAHGVAFGPDFVVATGLGDRTITKFDLAGNTITRAGAPGWGDGRYLWPTCVYRRGDRLYVADAHTGRLSTLDFDLRPADWVGGNGYGAGLFNMPYGVAGRPGELVVCDTFKSRLLVLDDAFRCVRLVTPELDPPDWNVSPPAGDRRQGYVDVSHLSPAVVPGVPARMWEPTYGGYRVGDHGQTAYFPPAGSLLNPGGIPYFCWCRPADGSGGRYLILGHQVGRLVLVVDRRGRAHVAPLPGPIWPTEAGYRTNAGREYDLTPLVEAAARRFAEHDRLMAAGVHAVEAVRQAYWPDRSAVEFRESLGRAFTSPAGAEFWADWAQDPDGAARRFDARTGGGQEDIWLHERFLRNMLRPPDGP